jgi:hypothetical protein
LCHGAPAGLAAPGVVWVRAEFALQSFAEFALSFFLFLFSGLFSFGWVKASSNLFCRIGLFSTVLVGVA